MHLFEYDTSNEVWTHHTPDTSSAVQLKIECSWEYIKYLSVDAKIHAISSYWDLSNKVSRKLCNPNPFKFLTLNYRLWQIIIHKKIIYTGLHLLRLHDWGQQFEYTPQRLLHFLRTHLQVRFLLLLFPMRKELTSDWFSLGHVDVVRVISAVGLRLGGLVVGEFVGLFVGCGVTSS